MREVAREERPAARRAPLALAEIEDRLAGERPQVLRRAEHRPAERVLAVGRLVEQPVRHVGRLVVGARDLLYHHAALTIELVGVDARSADEVRQQVDRGHGGLRAARDVERNHVVRRVRVELRAHPLGRLVHVAIRGIGLAALEDEVLEEVRHAVLLRALGPRAGIERDERGEGAGPGHGQPDQRQPVVERGGGDRDHPLRAYRRAQPYRRGNIGPWQHVDFPRSGRSRSSSPSSSPHRPRPRRRRSPRAP